MTTGGPEEPPARSALSVQSESGPSSRAAGWIPWMVLSGAFSYAFFRYVVFGETSPAHIPLFVANKALALGAVLFLLLAGYACVRDTEAKRWGRWALHTAALHALISVLLLSESYYPAFFGDDRLSLAGELSLLAAVLALYCFVTIGRVSGKRAQSRHALAASMLATGHVAVFGLPGWLDIASWHGGLPPISLLGFVIALAAAVAYAAVLLSNAAK